MTMGSDSSSVLSEEECEKGLLHLSPTELFLQRIISNCEVSPRAADSVPSLPGSCLAYTAPEPKLCSKFPRFFAICSFIKELGAKH